MGDLDISLIKEFARRPGFYDRGNSNFKDKTYIQQAWMEISNHLGYDAHLLKDRMYQLRNRYNLEKRRLENIRMEDPTNSVRSPWPLFYHLTFLDGHIRPRRSYKRMMRRCGERESVSVKVKGCNDVVVPSASMLVGVGVGGVGGDGGPNPNTAAHLQHHQYYKENGGSTDVKYETEMESDDDQQQSVENGSHFLDPTSFLADDSEEISETTQSNFPNRDSSQTNSQSDTPATINGIKVKNIESMKRDSSSIMEDEVSAGKKLATKMSHYEKYEAFGRFLAISLCDLSEERALALVEKFTSDVVQALLEKK